MSLSVYYEIGKKAPQPEDFNLSKEKIALEEKNREKIKKGPQAWPAFLGISIACGIPFIGYLLRSPLICIAILISSLIITTIIHDEQKKKIENIKINDNYDKYVQAIKIWEMSQNSFWTNINGITFEHRIAKLLRFKGYSIKLTPASNDGGVDIIAKKNGITIAVQCKCHKKPIGPSVARELYGVMQSRKSEFQEGMIICPSGFTKGVYDFVRNKPISLIKLSDIIRTAQGGEL